MLCLLPSPRPSPTPEVTSFERPNAKTGTERKRVCRVDLLSCCAPMWWVPQARLGEQNSGYISVLRTHAKGVRIFGQEEDEET